MAIDNPEVIDAIGVEISSGSVVLTIADAWDWSDEGSHLLALQNKLNNYFSFIESGQLEESYPNAVGRKRVIDLITRYPLSETGADLLAKAKAIAWDDLGVELRSWCKPD